MSIRVADELEIQKRKEVLILGMKKLYYIVISNEMVWMVDLKYLVLYRI